MLKGSAGGCNCMMKVAIDVYFPFLVKWYNDNLCYQVAFLFPIFFPLHPFPTLSIFCLLKTSKNTSASMWNQSLSKWLSLESLNSYTNKYFHILKTPSIVSINKWYKIASSKLPFEEINKEVAFITAVCRKIQLWT